MTTSVDRVHRFHDAPDTLLPLQRTVYWSGSDLSNSLRSFRAATTRFAVSWEHPVGCS